MSEVQLGTFIENALIEIARGVRGANEKLKDPDKHQFEVFSLRDNRGDNNKVPGIKFDVAVTASEKQSDKAGFVVALMNIAGGANTEKSRGNETAHRIQFEVGIQGTWN